MRTASSLIEELRVLDESTTIEAKTCRKVDRSVLETVCAFANEPALGGGYLLLGVAAIQDARTGARRYEVTGLENPDTVQSDLASQCSTSFNRSIRPQIRIERLEEKTVAVVFVAELSPGEKPVFLQSLGLPRGAFRRTGSTDQQGTEDDLRALYEDHQGDAYDAAVVRDAHLHDFDEEAVRAYRDLRTKANPLAEELSYTDGELLRALGAVDGAQRPTVAGLLLFGSSSALRRCFPMMRVDYIRVPTREWVQDPDHRFDTIEIRAPLLLAARRAIAAVRDDLPATFELAADATSRVDDTILPLRVLREAIVNAVMHRSYRINGAVQIIRYPNRLEIRNPGHSLKSEEQFGEPGSQTRNPRIAAVLHEVQLAETKGSGMRAMRQLMLQHDLVPPTFETSRSPDQFVATFLFHHFLGPTDLEWLRKLTSERLNDEEARALVFVRELGAIDNAAYRSINGTDTLQASTHLRRLRDLELLEMKGAGSKTHYLPTSRFLSATPSDPHQPLADPHQPQLDPHQPQLDPHQPSNAPPLSLKARLQQMGKRPRSPVVRALIIELCRWRPLSSRELAGLLGGRAPKTLVREHLTPMVESGALELSIKEMPNHPDQKYSVPTE